MKYKQCKVEYTDEPNNFEIRATSFYIEQREKGKKYNRAKEEKKFLKEER